MRFRMHMRMRTNNCVCALNDFRSILSTFGDGILCCCCRVCCYGHDNVWEKGKQQTEKATNVNNESSIVNWINWPNQKYFLLHPTSSSSSSFSLPLPIPFFLSFALFFVFGLFNLLRIILIEEITRFVPRIWCRMAKFAINLCPSGVQLSGAVCV